MDYREQEDVWPPPPTKIGTKRVLIWSRYSKGNKTKEIRYKPT